MNREKSLSISKLDSFSSQNKINVQEQMGHSSFDLMLSHGDSIRQKSFTNLMKKFSVVKLNGINIKV